MVDPAVKTGVALFVLLAGVCGAMLFHRDKAPAADAPPQTATEPSVLLRYHGEAPGPVARARQRRAIPAPVAKSSTSTQPPTVVAPLDRHESPPSLAADFPATGRPASSQWGVSMAMMLPPADAAAQTHRIVDGDTLPALAQRYLGSAERAAEIFELNRDVLRDPNLLPIGIEIKLPPRNAPPAMVPVR